MNVQSAAAGKKIWEYRRTGFYHAREVAEMTETSPGWSEDVCRERDERLLRWAAEEWGEDQA